MPILANALVALRSAPELADALAYDEMLRAAVLMIPPSANASSIA